MFHLGQEKVNFKFTLTFIELSLFDAGLKDVKVDDKDSKFLISWTRGSKKSDKTEPVEIQNSLLKWTKSFPISATLFREKKGDGFQKKVVNVNLVSLGKKGKSKTIGSGEINLAQYATEETEKIAKEIQSVLKIGKKPAMLKSLIECKNLKLSKSGYLLWLSKKNSFKIFKLTIVIYFLP